MTCLKLKKPYPFIYPFVFFLIFACAPMETQVYESPVYEALGGQPEVKVAIVKGEKKVVLSGSTISYKAGGRKGTLRKGRLVVEATGKGLRLNGKGYYSSSIQIDGLDIKVEGRPYRGALRLIIEDGAVTVVNRIGLEEYLMGIINHEISSAWSIEAVKAQAVAARTYAYDKLKSRSTQAYHLQATVMDQVYGGSGTEDSRAIGAVNDTKGEVLFYGNKVAQALFHSSCGGHTEAAEMVWGGDYPYLRGVEDPYCTEAPNYFWIYQASFDSIAGLFSRAGYPSSRDFSISGRTDSGRAKSVYYGKTEVSGNELRKILGYSKLKSALFDVRTEDDGLVFSGSGSGHGVGLCQWGAKGMAEEGFHYNEILDFYYRGTELKKVY
ncbi:MAG: SpoIID/LytB domain-containing protein [Proteobacteria bacterium]|nr:SpoIID/LytB domain-containing protein [Pseudomonadota bacterium]